jgi:phage terminase Nu1 subunit (DNA packaging protein)
MSIPGEFVEPPKRQFVSERTLSRITDCSVRTFQNWRARGGGPNYYRVNGSLIRYDLAEALNWFRSQPRRRRIA